MGGCVANRPLKEEFINGKVTAEATRLNNKDTTIMKDVKDSIQTLKKEEKINAANPAASVAAPPINTDNVLKKIEGLQKLQVTPIQKQKIQQEMRNKLDEGASTAYEFKQKLLFPDIQVL